MTWSKTEAGVIKDHGKTLKTIETALLGNLETKEPGLIDDVRKISALTASNSAKLDTNKRQHLWFLLGLSFCVIGLIFGLLNGTIGNLVEFIIRVRN